MDQSSAVRAAAESIVARETASAALVTADHALGCFELGTITLGDLLSALSYAGALADRARMRGWAFLDKTRGYS